LESRDKFVPASVAVGGNIVIMMIIKKIENYGFLIIYSTHLLPLIKAPSNVAASRWSPAK
jgi:hypothetical protein